MDEAPKTPDESEPHPLIDRVRHEVAVTAWVAEAVVALRENGHLITGEVWVVPRGGTDLETACERLMRDLGEIAWRLDAIVVVPLESLSDVRTAFASDPGDAGASRAPCAFSFSGAVPG